jgi:hypothetical protein
MTRLAAFSRLLTPSLSAAVVYYPSAVETG